VLDGDLDPFIQAYLRTKAAGKMKKGGSSDEDL